MVMLHLDRTSYMLDQTPHVEVRGLRPGQCVSVTLSHQDNVQQSWSSRGEFAADHQGSVKLDSAPSRAGSYVGVDPEGLLWSLGADGYASAVAFTSAAADPMHCWGQPGGDPLLPRRFMLGAEVEGRRVAETGFEQTRMSPTTRVEAVDDGALKGLAFHSDSRVSDPGAVLMVTGSGGGVERDFAPLLAANGIHVLSIASFAYPGRPDDAFELDLEYFAAAAAWMRKRWNCRQIAVQGASRGGELALLLASLLRDEFAGAVALVPWHNVMGGNRGASAEVGAAWRLGGRPLAYAGASMMEQPHLMVPTVDGLDLAEAFMQTAADDTSDEHFAIPVERAKGPLLLISGRDDRLWPSAHAADRVMDRLRRFGRSEGARHLALDNVGHLIMPPGLPTTYRRTLFHPLAHMSLACGGQPRAMAEGARTAWSAMRQYYQQMFSAAAGT